MLKIEFDLKSFEDVELVCLADVHLGNPLCDEVAFVNAINYVLEEPDDPKCARICLLNGDLTESVTKSSKGDIYNQTLSPSLQMAMMINYLKPLTEKTERYPQGKILSYCAGNHDNGRYSDTGISMSETIAVQLGLEDRYSTDGCYSFVKVKRIGCKEYDKNGGATFTIYNTHMSGGSSTIGGKASRIGKISSGIIADLIVGSHVHTPLAFKDDVIVPVLSKRALNQQTITYLITNAFLRYGDYAQRNGYKPSTITVPKVYLRQGRDNLTNKLKFVETIL